MSTSHSILFKPIFYLQLRFETLHTFDTEYSADSVEWCPHPAYQTFFACGTYQLQEDSNDEAAACQRKGRIYLFKFDPNSEELAELQRLESAAILDMKWLLQPAQNPKLATANALGQVEIYELVDQTLELRHSLQLRAECSKLLALSLDWRLTQPETVPEVLVSDSQGGVSLIGCAANGDLNVEQNWSAHNFEAWICAFDRWDEHRFYTGGDDCLLRAYDLRCAAPALTNKCHNAGVTCLLSHPKREHVLFTGSYDEQLRIFDTRALKQPLGEVNLGGGIWRLRCDPWHGDQILAACMYKDFSIVQLDAESLGEAQVVGAYAEHASICYGADWCLSAGKDDEVRYTATCSFYDHKMCLARVRMDEE